MNRTHTPEEFATYFEVSVGTIYREIREGQLRAALIRSSLRILDDEITHYLQDSRESRSRVSPARRSTSPFRVRTRVPAGWKPALRRR